MRHRKPNKESDQDVRARVTKEMTKSRTARSARIAELNLNPRRPPERPTTTLPGIVDKIIPSPGKGQPEKIQIAVDAPDRQDRDLRIENSLTDEHGDNLKLKEGAHVEVTVSTDAKISTSAINADRLPKRR
jgi:hypothetical protein